MKSTFRDAIKLTALVFMVIDHLAVFVMRPLLLDMGTAPNEFVPYLLFRGLGRIAFPMFAFAFAISIYDVRRDYSDPLARSEICFRRARLMAVAFFIACLVHGFCLAISGQGVHHWLEALASLNFEKIFLSFLPVNILGSLTLSYLAVGTFYSMWGWALRSLVLSLILVGSLAVEYHWFGLFLPLAFFVGLLALDFASSTMRSIRPLKLLKPIHSKSSVVSMSTKAMLEASFVLAIAILAVITVFVVFGGAANKNHLALISLPLICVLWFLSKNKPTKEADLDSPSRLGQRRLVKNRNFFINFYVYHPVILVGLYLCLRLLD